jgi:hypothetical protein
LGFTSHGVHGQSAYITFKTRYIYILEEEPRLGYTDFIVKNNMHWFGGGIGKNTIENNVFEVDNNNHRMNTKSSK